MTFCVFDMRICAFVGLDRDEAHVVLTSLDLAAPPAPPPRDRIDGHIRRPLQPRVLQLLKRVPVELQPPVAEMIKAGYHVLRAAAGLCYAILRWTGLRRPPAPPHNPLDGRAAIRFAPGDVLVSVGMACNHRFLPYVFRHKRSLGLKLLILCHDLIGVEFPQLVVRGYYRTLQECFADMVWAAHKILCNSAATRDALHRLVAAVDLPQPATAVFHLGTDIPALAAERPPAGLDGLRSGGFVLCVGTIEVRKNHRLLYQLWARLAEQEPDLIIPLLLVGDRGWSTDDLVRIMTADRRLRGKLLLLHDLPDAELAWLYSHCRFTLYPSFVEGWGLPVAESLALGKYCVASTAPSIPEAAQGLLDLIDPLDFAAWYAEIRRLLREPAYLAAKQQRLAAFRPVSWHEAGERLHAEIASCA